MISSRWTTASALDVKINPPVPVRAKSAMSDSISPVSRTSIALVSTLSDDATDWMTANWPMPDAMVASRSTAARVRPRGDFLERLQPFCAQAVLELDEAGDVAARPRHALDEAGTDRVGDVVEHD